MGQRDPHTDGSLNRSSAKCRAMAREYNAIKPGPGISRFPDARAEMKTGPRATRSTATINQYARDLGRAPVLREAIAKHVRRDVLACRSIRKKELTVCCGAD